MQMVIPCGGLATRLGDIAKNTPKAMLSINGKPFLERQINLIKKYDFDEIVLCIGHLGEQIYDYFKDGNEFGIRIKYSKDDGLGVIGAVKNAEDILEPHFFIMYGDSYLPELDFNDMYFKFIGQDLLAMMSIWRNMNYLDKSNITTDGKIILSVGQPNSQYIDYGAIVFNKKALHIVPGNHHFSTGQMWTVLAQNRQLATYVVHTRFFNIGDPEQLEEVRRLSH